MELSCWGGGWGIPSVHSESLVVLVRPPRWPGRGRTGLASRGLRWGPAGRLQASGPDGLAVPSRQWEKARRPCSLRPCLLQTEVPRSGKPASPRRGRGAGSRRLPLRVQLSELRCRPARLLKIPKISHCTLCFRHMPNFLAHP